jgi:hypothetical protein
MEKMEYVRQGNYLIPALTLGEQPTYGKYGMLRKTYLKSHRPGLYSSLILSRKLSEHLADIDKRSKALLDELVQNYLKEHPAPDKATRQMEWVGYMNNLKHSMEEIVLNEFVYCVY